MSTMRRPFMNISAEQAGLTYQQNTNCDDKSRESYEQGFEDAKQVFGINLLHEISLRQDGLVDRVIRRLEVNQAILLPNNPSEY